MAIKPYSFCGIISWGFTSTKMGNAYQEILDIEKIIWWLVYAWQAFKNIRIFSLPPTLSFSVRRIHELIEGSSFIFSCLIPVSRINDMFLRVCLLYFVSSSFPVCNTPPPPFPLSTCFSHTSPLSRYSSHKSCNWRRKSGTGSLT